MREFARPALETTSSGAERHSGKTPEFRTLDYPEGLPTHFPLSCNR
jgi:hypothetical protein